MFGEGRRICPQKVSLVMVFMQYVLLIGMYSHYGSSSKIGVISISATIQTCPLSNGKTE